MSAVMLAGLPGGAAHAADRDRDAKAKGSTLKMKPRQVSKHTAKLRKESIKNRNKQMADIKKSRQRKKH